MSFFAFFPPLIMTGHNFSVTFSNLATNCLCLIESIYLKRTFKCSTNLQSLQTLPNTMTQAGEHKYRKELLLPFHVRQHPMRVY